MDRRTFLVSAGALSTSFATTAFAADKAVPPAPAMEDHSHHHGGPYPAVAAAASDCIKTGQVCIDHCLSLLGSGDTSLSGCAKSVEQMLALCGALQQLGAQHSTYLPGLAKVALQACKDCEKECRKHETKHQQCKDCANSCAACAKECEAISA